MNQFDLKNRTALITGGAQGFGFDITKKFLNSDANVIIWDNDEKELKNAVKKINNSKLSYNVVDVSNFEKINQTVLEINKKTNIDILINNAAIDPKVNKDSVIETSRLENFLLFLIIPVNLPKGSFQVLNNPVLHHFHKAYAPLEDKQVNKLENNYG